MKFGVFDHLDRSPGFRLDELYESRLKLLEAYDRAGFYAYHLAEHHSTPLGMAPSPSVFLAAVAQRTSRLRFGAMIYALPFYHPLRLIEEICMLDQMSGGRLELGFGRGASPIEMANFGLTPERTQDIYTEGMQVVLKGLSQPVLTYEGEYFRFVDVPMELEPIQKPHPPIWYGAHTLASAEKAALAGFNIINNDSLADAETTMERYQNVWRASHQADAPFPMMGLARFIVVAPNDEDALAIARRAYVRWHESFTHLYRAHGRSPMHGERARTFDGLRDVEIKGIAGSPKTVADFLNAHVERAGANYLVGQFVFGDMTVSESLQSIDLFAREVMPQIKDAPPMGPTFGVSLKNS
jgi:alkanesulfonate monooxygenase SsuD/methylene tetrahydromethanopterin reductase-like flavin-dependent oxidoreductase (luciferase family)